MLRSLTIALTIAAFAADATGQRRRGSKPKLENFTTRLGDFESKALGERDSVYRVFLPKGYDDKANKDTRYPLVIWLHGMWEDHDRFYTRGGAKVLDKLRGEDEIPEMVVVCANGSRSSFYINGAAKGTAYEDLIAKDLLEHCDETYRIKAEHTSRAIVGVSMGGYGALKIAFKHPQSFGVVAAHSAAILPRDPKKLDEAFPWLERWGGAQKAIGSIFGKEITTEKWNAENVLCIAEALEPKRLHGLKIYLDCGDADSYGFFAPNQELVKTLEKRKIKHTWRAVEGGQHGWRRGYNQEAIPNSLRFVAASFTVQRATSGLGGLFGTGAEDKKDPQRK